MENYTRARAFFDQYGFIGTTDNLFALFVAWQARTQPTIHHEKAAYLALCDVREFFQRLGEMIQSEEGLHVGLHLLPECDTAILDNMIIDLKGKNYDDRFIKNLKSFLQELSLG